MSFTMSWSFDVTHAHFAYGWINPLMGFGFALAGSFLGLTCMVHARHMPKGRGRLRWLIFASLAIGGTGIWMMHFIAMIGFAVKDSDVRYDIPITVASLVISIVSVAFGLFVVGMGDPSFGKIIVGGPLTGLGVVAMHYAGMAAVNISGDIHYDPAWVAASVAIALVAATVALFFTTWVDGKMSLTIAAVIMAIAVCGMHYTGMGAISVTLRNGGSEPVPGANPLLLLIPILLLATILLIALIFGVLGDREEDSELPARVERPVQEDPRLRGSAMNRQAPSAAAAAAAPASSSFWTPEVTTADPGLNPERRRSVNAASVAAQSAQLRDRGREHGRLPQRTPLSE
jgi:NO-binding membrane sensor protein with MHYT domain